MSKKLGKTWRSKVQEDGVAAKLMEFSVANDLPKKLRGIQTLRFRCQKNISDASQILQCFEHQK